MRRFVGRTTLPGPRAPATRSAQLVAQRLTEIAEEARSAAGAAEQSIVRLKPSRSVPVRLRSSCWAVQ